MHLLMIGDIVGKSGRKAIKDLLPAIKKEYKIDFTVANAENAAGGNGLTQKVMEELYESGIDALTMGNHVWDKKEIYEFIDNEETLLRPANYPPDSPGKGWNIVASEKGVKVGLMNFSGRVFMQPLDCPFRVFDEIIADVQSYTKIILVDFHAETTSEKIAFGWFVDGRVSAVCGTHTHVQTADSRVLHNGTGYITDVGMTGPRDSVLGVKTDLVIQRFLSQQPVKFEIAKGELQLNAVYLEVDKNTGKCLDIKPIQKFVD